MLAPAHALEAVTHTDPYPFYASLRQSRALAWDEELGLWVAASAEAVELALTHPDLRVRPAHEPVPKALGANAAAQLFALLVRMKDGAFHAEHKPQVNTLVAERLTQLAGLAARLAPELQQRLDANEFLVQLPVQVIAASLGVPPQQLEPVTRQVLAFTRGLVAGATPSQVERADAAASSLTDFWQARGPSPVQAAHRIGLMMQSLDATAGLLGNTAVLLERQPGLAPRWLASHDAASELVAEVARWDAPIQNTRRFAAVALKLMGRPIEAGQCVLLLLASANRDEILNARAEAFDPGRLRRRSLGFGAGAHACPAEQIAMEIVAAGARALWAGGQFHSYFRASGAYVALPNARIPVFAA